MQLNCFASAQEPGIPNSSLILCASFIRCLVMRECAWEREQHVSYASRWSACGGNSVSSAWQEWRLRSPGEAKRQWNSCSLRGGAGWLTPLQEDGTWGWLRGGGARRRWAGQGALLGAHWWKFPRWFHTDARWLPAHFKKHSDLMNSMSTANSVFIRLHSALKTFPYSRPVWFKKHQ